MGESFPTDLTAIGFLAAVYPLVDGELGALRKGGAAMSASVRLLLFVRAHVLRQVTLQIFVADVAVESLHVVVDAVEMLAQSVAPKEALAAYITYVISDLQVAFRVQLQVSRTGERGVAHSAHEWFRTSMFSHVLDQLTAAGELHVAHQTHVRLVAGVYPQVEPQTFLDGEHLVAIVADEYVRLNDARRVFGGHVIF